MENLKYYEKISTHFGQVSFNDFHENECECFRFVHEDLDDQRNFLPPYVLNDSRPKTKFTGYALSLFESKRAAIDRILYLAGGKSNIFKKLGTHIALGKIDRSCGIRGSSNEDGHFDLFEYKEVLLRPYFVLESKIL